MTSDRMSVPDLPPSVTVVIPLHREGPLFRKCLNKMLQVEYPLCEIVIVTDEVDITLPSQVIHLSTGSMIATPPGVKRDLGLASTDSKYVAFIDDDAYPRPDWLLQAVAFLEQHESAAGVGGPGLTPPDSSFRERASGAIYQSLFGSGPLRFRFLQSEERRVDDLPAYNFIARRSALQAVGGWASTFYGGEDTKLCLELVKNGFLLHYSPQVVVYHYRRAVPIAHMRQVANVGMHRGFFLKRFPGTSRRFVYLMPAIVVLFLLTMLLTTFWYDRGAVLSLTVILLAYLLVVGETMRRERLFVALSLPVFLFAHHVAYAFGFFRGLLHRDLKT